MSQWLLMNIGCIECGISSKVVGVFSDKVRAEVLAAQLDDTHGWRNGGQNSYEVHELPDPNIVDKEYLNPAES